MSITLLRNPTTGRTRMGARSRNDGSSRKLTEATRAAAELLAAKAALHRELEIERFENTRLTQEIVALRRALRRAERALDLAQSPA